MNGAQLFAAALLAGVCVPWVARGAESTADDRIAIAADGATLTGTHGGEGGSLGWLHNFDAASLVGVAVEHQVIQLVRGDSHWTFGSVNGSLTLGPDNARYSIFGEAHEGSGNDGAHGFHYSIEAAGVTGTYFHKLSAQLEDRRIDVESTHGNLPKAGLSYLWGPHLLTSVSYSHSVSGNLGTRLAGARIDAYTSSVNLLAGVAFGPTAPSLIFPQPGAANLVVPRKYLHEGYVGASKAFPRLRSELTVVADYQNLSHSKHATLTINYIFHVGHTGTGR